MIHPVVLSYVQIEPILAARQKGLTSVEVSPDLGISRVNAVITAAGVRFPSGEQLDWQQVEKIKKAHNSCFIVEDGTIKTITPQGLIVIQEVNDPLSLVKQREVRKLLRSLEDAKE